MYFIDREGFFELLKRLAERGELFVIKDNRYERIEEPRSISVPDGPQKFSPKELVHPQDETLMKFEREGVVLPERKNRMIVYAIRPCDAFAIELLDKIFYAEPKDPYYIQRRENIVFISIACKNALPTCFCTSFNSFDPYKLYSADLLLFETDNGFVLLDASTKGKQLTEGWRNINDAEITERIRISKETLIENLNRNKVSTAKLKERLLNRFNDMDFWRGFGERCINCGICTYLCPTCYCFDIDDERLGKRIRRARIWDSCQFPYFTLEASGHNPRENKLTRVRQRFMHKLSFYPTSYGEYQCVGCGRCVIFCPVNIDIREIINNA